MQQICEEAAQGEVCQAANLNSPDQTVISGNKAAVERAAELAKQRGAKRAIMLPVSAPFHCALMQPAQDRLADDLRALTFHAPASSGDVQRGCRAGDDRASRRAMRSSAR